MGLLVHSVGLAEQRDQPDRHQLNPNSQDLWLLPQCDHIAIAYHRLRPNEQPGGAWTRDAEWKNISTVRYVSFDNGQ